MESDFKGGLPPVQSKVKERVIYRSSYLPLVNGEVSVTNKRLILGKEAWSIKDVQDAELVSVEMSISRVPINSRTITGFLSRLVLSGSAMLIIMLAPNDGIQILFIMAAVLLFVLSLLTFVLTAAKNPNTVYRIRLTLASSDGTNWQHESAYVWLDRWYVDKAVGAIHGAIKERDAAGV